MSAAMTAPPSGSGGAHRASRHPKPRRRLRALLLAVGWTATCALAQAPQPDGADTTATGPIPAAGDPAQRPQRTADPLTAALPAGSILAFVPAASGYAGTGANLRDWLAERGWAICDGTRGTPDLRGQMLLGTTDPVTVGQRLGSRDHDHRVRGESDAPVMRNRHTPTGRGPLKHLPDDRHRHGLNVSTDRSEHLPPSTRVLFIMKLL
jgi:hypothetical protein